MFSKCYNSWVKLRRNRKTCERITKIKPFINKYNWEGTNYPSDKDNWKKFEKRKHFAKKEKNISFLYLKT